MKVYPLKLDAWYDAKLLNDNRVEQVIELTNADHSETFGYLCGGSPEQDDISQAIVDRINRPTPKIQAILDLISSAPDNAGRVYWAFRYTRTEDGRQVTGTITGGESNLSAAKGKAGLCPSENVYYTYHELPIRLFNDTVADWPYAGCQPQKIAEFIQAGLSACESSTLLPAT